VRGVKNRRPQQKAPPKRGHVGKASLNALISLVRLAC